MIFIKVSDGIAFLWKSVFLCLKLVDWARFVASGSAYEDA